MYTTSSSASTYKLVRHDMGVVDTKHMTTFAVYINRTVLERCIAKQTSKMSGCERNVTNEPPDVLKGAEIFRMRCATCHTTEHNGAPELYDPNGGQHTGPNLYGVFGRKVASESNYTNYSTQALYKDTVWDEENLDKFLTNPKRFIPGTKMVFIGLKNGKDRKDLIAHLMEVTTRK